MSAMHRSCKPVLLVASFMLLGTTTLANAQQRNERRSDPFPGSGHFPGFGKRLRVTTAVYHRPSLTFGDSMSTFVHVGRLAMWTADSVVLTLKSRHEIAIPRSIVTRVDTAAGHKSRLLRAIIGVPIGIAVGGLLGKPAGHGAVMGLSALGAPAGLIVGALTGGQRWRRVTLSPPYTIAGAGQ